jgi:hypothetical protein
MPQPRQKFAAKSALLLFLLLMGSLLLLSACMGIGGTDPGEEESKPETSLSIVSRNPILGDGQENAVPSPPIVSGDAATLPKSDVNHEAEDEPESSSTQSTSESDTLFQSLFDAQAEDVAVSGSGTVIRLLSDDTEGDKHQRFIVELASGQTLLIVHNIDIAPRVTPLEVGDVVSFVGEYVWNEEGGLVHWTHHDPDGTHAGGSIIREGMVFQ